MADEVLELRPHIKGNIAKPLRAELGAPLTEEDIASLADEPREPTRNPGTTLVRLRDSHHRLARCLATGMNQLQASLQTGYSQQRIRVLLEDNSFKDLVAIYRKEGNTEFVDFQSLAVANMHRAERIISETLEDVSERETPLSPAELRPIFEIAAQRMDRFGYPAHSVGHNVNHELAGRLKSARLRSGLVEAKEPLVIEELPKGEPVPDES